VGLRTHSHECRAHTHWLDFLKALKIGSLIHSHGNRKSIWGKHATRTVSNETKSELLFARTIFFNSRVFNASRPLSEWKRLRMKAITRLLHLTVPFKDMQPAEYICWESCIPSKKSPVDASRDSPFTTWMDERLNVFRSLWYRRICKSSKKITLGAWYWN